MSIADNISFISQLAFSTLLPVAVTLAFNALISHTRFGKLPYWTKQILIGICFGAVAIFGTEFGIDVDGAVINVRDAAPITAGLFFGGPAGIIAGVIGGVERWFAVLWGAGEFTRVACSVATIAAGFYAALLNRFLFDKRKPSWPLALTVGMVAEVLHLLLIFLTNMGEPSHAFQVVQVCTVPMISCNGIAVALSGLVDSWFRRRGDEERPAKPEISQMIQAGMLVVVLVGFVASTAFNFAVHQNNTLYDTQDALKLEIADVENDILDASNDMLQSFTMLAASQFHSAASASLDSLAEFARDFGIEEISIIDSDGIIVVSNDQSLVGNDVRSRQGLDDFTSKIAEGDSTEVDSYVGDYKPMADDRSEWRKYAYQRIDDGYIMVGCDLYNFMDNLRNNIKSAVLNRHIGRSGFLLVVDDNGTVIGTRRDIVLSDADVTAIMTASKSVSDGSLYRVTFGGTDYFGVKEVVEGLSVHAFMDATEAMRGRDLAVLVTSFIEVIVFATLFAAIYVIVKRLVVSSIWKVNGTLDQITSGDLDAKVNVRNSADFDSLSDYINRTVDALHDAIDAESARIERDLATAKAIQESALPSTFPPFPDIDSFDIYASMKAACEVGGDFYDFFLVDDHTLGFLIADVSGKGIPASLFMMAAKSELATRMTSGMNLADAVRSANWSLCQGNDAGMFVTVWAATLDYKTGELTFVNAGHNPPLLRHDGKWSWITDRCGLFLGTFETAKYRTKTIMLSPTDELLLYTDGVNEAFSVDEEEYGNDRLEAFVANHADMHPHILVDALRSDVQRWAKGAEQSDDITIMCLEYDVAPEITGTLTVNATNEGREELRYRLTRKLSHLQCPLEVQRIIDAALTTHFDDACRLAYASFEEVGTVQMSYVFGSDSRSVVVGLTDWGAPFDPAESDISYGDVDDVAYMRDNDMNVIAFRKKW